MCIELLVSFCERTRSYNHESCCRDVTDISLFKFENKNRVNKCLSSVKKLFAETSEVADYWFRNKLASNFWQGELTFQVSLCGPAVYIPVFRSSVPKFFES